MTQSIRLAAVGIFVRREMGVSQIELTSKRREGIPARALFVWLARESFDSPPSFTAIGRWLGHADHVSASFLHKVTAPRLLAEDPQFAALCSRFQAQETVQ